VTSRYIKVPNNDFVKFVLNTGVYDGVKTQNIIDKYRPIIKKSVSQYINELVNDKIQNALKNNNLEQEVIEIVEEDTTVSDIVTTDDELQSYYIVKSIIGDIVPMKRISYKDTISYFSILLDGKVTKWICRIFLKENIKYIIIPNETDNIRYTINSLEDIYKLSSEIKSRVNILVN